MVQDRLRDAIIEGHFKPADRLVERALCEQFGVSRTVIRETIRCLEAEGPVEILPGHGPIAATMSRDNARQIYDIRRMPETAAARRCAFGAVFLARGKAETLEGTALHRRVIIEFESMEAARFARSGACHAEIALIEGLAE